mmetsp:Transcript_54790/g.146465  ORF Transcript_54790/g.146465 Transcript_54790/m.146465 type:complete len:285 (-) Transcript_54790:640-1494(-)
MDQPRRHWANDLVRHELEVVLLPDVRPSLPEGRVESGQVVLLRPFAPDVLWVVVVEALHQHLAEGLLAGLQQAHATVDADLLKRTMITPEVIARKRHPVVIRVVPDLGRRGLEVEQPRDIVPAQYVDIHQHHLGILRLSKYQQLRVHVQEARLPGVLEHAQGHSPPISHLLEGPESPEHIQHVPGDIRRMEKHSVVVAAETPQREAQHNGAQQVGEQGVGVLAVEDADISVARGHDLGGLIFSVEHTLDVLVARPALRRQIAHSQPPAPVLLVHQCARPLVVLP